MRKSKGKSDSLSKLGKKTAVNFPNQKSGSTQASGKKIAKNVRTHATDTQELKQAEQTLRTSEERYRGLFESMTEGFALHEIICDKKGKPCDYRFLEVNPAFEELTGLKRKDVIGKTVSQVLPDNDPQWVEIYGKVALTGKSTQFDSHSTPLNKDYEVFAYSPASKQFAVLFTDITERKNRERELHQLNRTLRALSKSSHAMMRWQEDEKAYLYAVCKVIVEDCGHKMVWIGYAEDDKYKSVRPVAYSGFEEGYLEKLKISWADVERGRGPTGTAVRSGKVSVCRNMLTDPKFEPWRKEAIKRGYASSIVLPLKNVYKTFGALNIYSKEPDPFSEDEVKLLTELANDLAHGITMIRLRASEKRAEEQLRESEERFRAAFLRGSIAMALTSLDHKLMKVNPAFCQMLGFTEAELVNRRFTEVTHPDDVAPNIAGLKRIISGEAGSFRMEKRYIRKDGSVIWTDMSTAAVRDAQGKALYIVTHVQDITERKRAEDALKKSQALLGAVMESTSDPVYVKDRQSRILMCNPALEKIAGKPAAEIIGKTDSEYYEDDAVGQALQQNDLRVMESGRIQIFEETAKTPDGYRVFLSSKAPYRNESGDIIGIIGISHDITERKQAEESLRQSEERLKQSQEIAHLGSWELDLVSNRLTWSDEVYRIFGLAPQEFGATYEAFLDRVYPDDRAAVDEAYSGSLRDNRDTYEIEHRVVRKDTGEIRTVHEKCEHFRDAGGKIVRSVGMVHDITEQKLAEEALKVSERRFRTLSEAGPGIAWTAEPDGTTDYYNQRWYEYSGLPADAPESAWSQTIHPDDMEATSEGWITSVRTGIPYNIEHRIRRSDGNYRWHLTRGIPLRDVGGRIIKWFGMSMDIDDQKKAMEELERLRGELEGKNEELESIISIASHDLRSPLVNIRGFAGELSKDIHRVDELLKGVQLPQEVSEKVDKVFNKYVPESVGFIQNSAESLNQMLKGLMQVAKAGITAINLHDVDMNAILAKITDNVQFKLKESGGRLETASLPDCRADADLMTQVFTNLVENAIKYREPTRPINIRVYASADKDMVTYCVEDNGKGIAAPFHTKVFDLFTRIHPEAAKGEGLGLTIARRIIERQGGKIWVNSEVDKGSKFYVMMPR